MCLEEEKMFHESFSSKCLVLEDIPQSRHINTKNLRYSCREKDFSDEQDKTVWNVVKNKSFRYEKTFVKYNQKFIKCLTQIVLDFIHFVWTKGTETCHWHIYAQKAHFPTYLSETEILQ